MSDHDYTLQRICALETALRCVMVTVMGMMPPHAAEQISQIGWDWDKRLDELAAPHDTLKETS